MEATIEITPELMAGFLDESAEHLSALNTHLMRFEQLAEAGPVTLDDPENQQLMTELFRAAHSLKGLSGTFGFADINRLTHRMETLFDEARSGRRHLDSETLELLLNCVGVLEALVADLQAPSEHPPGIGDVMQQLERLLSGSGPDAPDEPAALAGHTHERAGGASSAGDPAAAPAAGEHVPETLLDDPELRKLFLETTEEAVADLNQKLLELEKDASEELLHEAFRVAHNLKGACGAAGLGDATQITHRMESVFDRLRGGALAVSGDIISVLLAVADRLGEVVQEIKADRYVAWSDDQIAALFEKLDGPAGASGATSGGSATNTARPDDQPSAAVPSAPCSSPPGTLPAAVLQSVGCGYHVTVTFSPDDAERDLQAFVILNHLKTVGEVVWVRPDLEKRLLGESCTLEFAIKDPKADGGGGDALASSLRRFSVETVTVTPIAESGTAASAADSWMKHRRDAGATEVEIGSKPSKPLARPAAPAKPTPSAPPAKDPAGRRPSVQTTTATIRVDVERLDQLMNLGGELVINRARFAQTAKEFKRVFEGKDVAYAADDIASQLALALDEAKSLSGGVPQLSGLADRLAGLSLEYQTVHELVRRVNQAKPTLHNFEEAVNTLERISEGLQKRIMDTRMVPVAPLFQRFQRLTRDLAKELGKKIAFVMSGENTELDKKMIDELADPLTHMIRNSADHGIESPQERTAAGKDPTATITLAAYYQGNTICIEVRDDGRGIDLGRIREKVVERELVTETQAAQMTDQELVQFVFHPGLSTAQQVSDLSGRGMGMDIVKTKIANLNGTLDVETKKGRGTTVVIRLPLTLAIISALQTQIGCEVYNLPLESVAEIVTIRRADICSVQGQRVAHVRDSVIPVLMLEEVLDVRLSELKTQCGPEDEWTIVILGVRSNRMGLVVDRMLGQEDIVIKSLAENYRNVHGFSGATIMGDGRVSLILDVGQLMRGRGSGREAA